MCFTVTPRRLVDGQARYAEYTKGYNVTQISRMYRENERINAEKKVRIARTCELAGKLRSTNYLPPGETKKKRLAEAIGLEKLTTSVLRSDLDRDHHVGENELVLLACRLESQDGVPFSGDDLIDAFAGRESRSLRDLAGVIQELYVEKRRHQARAREALHVDVSPRNLGTSILLGGKGAVLESATDELDFHLRTQVV